MIGKINIKGEIGSYRDRNGTEVKGVDLMDVVTQYQDQPEATSFEVTIDSLGGFCDVGYAIHNFLKSIKQPVTTIALNHCASIATVIFLAGSVRKAFCPLMIHNPWISGVEGDSDELESAFMDIKAEENKLIDFYAKATGLSKEALDHFMKTETYIKPEEALKLKFTTEATAPETISLNTNYRAVARVTDKNIMSKEIKDFLAKGNTLLDELKKFVKGDTTKKVKALKVQDQSGKTLDITNADGSDISGPPASGNIVMVDGAPAEGDYAIPEMNVTISVSKGVITTVSDTSQASVDKKLADALKQIDDLKKENDAAKAVIEENKKTSEAVNGKLTEFETLLKSMSGESAEHKAKSQFRNEDKDKTVEDIRKENDERKKKYNN